MKQYLQSQMMSFGSLMITLRQRADISIASHYVPRVARHTPGSIMAIVKNKLRTKLIQYEILAILLMQGSNNRFKMQKNNSANRINLTKCVNSMETAIIVMMISLILNATLRSLRSRWTCQEKCISCTNCSIKSRQIKLIKKCNHLEQQFEQSEKY